MIVKLMAHPCALPCALIFVVFYDNSHLCNLITFSDVGLCKRPFLSFRTKRNVAVFAPFATLLSSALLAIYRMSVLSTGKLVDLPM